MKSREKKKKNDLLIFTIILVSVIILVLFFIQIGKRTTNEKEFIPTDALKEELSNEVKDIIVSLDTPYKVVDYLNNDFSLLDGEDILPFSLERFIQGKKGTETDFAIFTTYVIEQHGAQASVLRYKYIIGDSQNEKIKSIVPLRISSEDIPKYIYFINGNSQIVEAGWAFREAIHKEEERLNIKATKYIAYFAGDFNLERGDGIWIEM